MNATISNEQEKASKSKASLMEMTLKASLLKKLTYVRTTGLRDDAFAQHYRGLF